MNKLGQFAAACAAVLCAFGAEATVLPTGYQEVEWIESTAKQSIDLGFKCVKEKTGLVMRFNSGKYQGDTAYFGTGWNGNCYLFCQQGNRYRFYASSVDLASSLNANCDMTITIVPRGNGNGDITLDCPTGSGWTTWPKENVSLSPSGNNLQVFGIGNSHTSAFRLYRLTITERTVTKDESNADVVTHGVIHDFVPCYRVEDNVIGLYDICATDAASAFKADTLNAEAFKKGDNVYYEDKLVVSAAPIACGEVTPAYGTYGEHVAGMSYTLTAPASWTSDDGLTRATCSACTVTAIDGEVVASETFSGEGDVRSVTYTHPDCEKGVEAVWQWAVKSKVTVEAKVGGTVSKSEEWVTFDEEFTVTATPDAANGFSFYRWTDANGATVSREATLTVKVSEPLSFTAEFAGTFYVDVLEGDDDAGDGSEKKAFATLQKALSVAADGSTILLQDGTYLMDDPFTTIARPITIKSVNGPENCSLTKAATAANSNKRGILKLNHDDAVVDGLTLRNGYVYNNADPGSPVVLTKGVVKNCIIRDNQGGSDGSGNHGGVTVQGGTLRDCVIRGNLAAYNNNSLGIGGGVYLSAGLVENCVITNNGAGGKGGGVYITGADSVLRNCFVGFNHGLPMSSPTTKNGNGGGICIAGGTVDRCTVRGNYSGTGGGVYLTGGKILNSLVLKNHGTNAGAGIRNEGGTVVNCTVTDNDANGTSTGTGFCQSKGTTQNTVIYGNPCGAAGDVTVSAGTFDHNFTMLAIAGYGDNAHGNVFYKDAANEDYTLLAGSKAIDGAVAHEGVETDLAGRARPQGAAPDMGCYEYLSGQGPLSCSFNAPDVTLFLEEGEATFVASADGANTTGLVYEWYFNGVLQEGETGSMITWASIPLGAHTVKLVVYNGAGETAECELKDVIKVTTTHVYANANGSNTYPYDTAEKGANKLQDALDAVWVPETGPGVVTVQPGRYAPYSKWFILDKPIRLVSAEGPSVTTLYADDPNGSSMDGRRVCRVLSVTHPQAYVEGFAVSNGWWYSAAGDSGPGGMRMSAGVVTNCVFTKNRGGDNGGAIQMSGGLLVDCEVKDSYSRYNNDGCNTRGGGIYMTGGTVDVCRVHNCWAAIADDMGGGIWASGGVIRRSEIYGNYSKNQNARGAGVCLSGSAVMENCVISNSCSGASIVNEGSGVYLKNGTMRNCLVAGNRANNSGAGVYQTGGTMEFCTVAGNTSVTFKNSGLYLNGANAVNRYNVIYENGKGVEGEPKCNLDFTKALTFANNIVAPVPDGTDNIATAPSFKSAEAGDYRLAAGSPAIDAATGLAEDYLTDDLVGTMRPQDGNGDGAAVCDLGCYEYVAGQGPLSCSCAQPDVTLFLEEGEATFFASVDGSDRSGLTFAWYFDGVLQETLTTDTVAWSQIPKGKHSVKVVVWNASGETAECELKDVVKVTTKHVYANETGSNVYPYDTAEKGANNLQDALDAVWVPEQGPATVTVGPGTYKCRTRWFVINKPIVLESSDGPATTTLQAYNPDDAGGYRRVINVNHPDAFVNGFTLKGGEWWSENGDSGPGGLRLQAGVVTNCVITGNRGCWIGGGVQMSGGLLVDCDIHDNHSIYNNNSTDTRGGGIYMTGGTVDVCRVHNCWAGISGDTGSGIWASGGVVRNSDIYGNWAHNTAAKGIGIFVKGTALVENCYITNNFTSGHIANDASGVYQAGGTVRNCLIAGNKANNGGAGVYQTGGTMEFCTVVGNTSVNIKNSGLYLNGESAVNRYNIIYANGKGIESEPKCNLDFVKAATFAKNIVLPATEGTDNIATAPGFKDAAAGDYTLGAGSPAIDAATGIESDYLTEDLAGDVRPKDGDGDGDAVCDLGCYEAPDASEGPLACSFSPLETVGLDEVTVTFEASVTGGGSKGELHYDWDFGEGVLVDGSADVPNPTVKFSTYGSHTVSLTVTAEGGKTATKTVLNCVKVGSAKVCVVQENANARWPFSTWETAATNLNEAFSSLTLAEGVTPEIVVSNGTYLVGQKAFILSFPIRITSLEGPEKTIVKAYNPADNGLSRGVFRIEHPDALVDGLTMTDANWDAYASSDSGAAALRLSAGVVSNCIIRNTYAGRSQYGAVSVSGTGLLTHSVIYGCRIDQSTSGSAEQHGAGLAIWGNGVVAHTVVSNCYATSGGGSCAGGGVYQMGGTLRDSAVLDCYISGQAFEGSAIWQSGGLCERCVFGDTKHKDSYGAAVYLTGGTNRNNLVRGAWTSKGAAQALQMTGGWFWNNTVVTNGWGSTQSSPVAADVTGGEVRNCLFACNNGADVRGESAKVRYSCFAEATGARYNIAAEPTFRNPKRGDWRLRGSSAGVNAGDATVWAGETNPTDLLGQPRIKNLKVDMGCCECQAEGFSLIVR